MQTPSMVKEDLVDFFHSNNICICPQAHDAMESQYAMALKERGELSSPITGDITHKCMAEEWSDKLVNRLESNGTLNFSA